MMNPEVSVIIPTYNRRAMAGEAVASAAGQEAVVLEVIVVDDGSTDGTFEELCALGASLEKGRGTVSIRVERTENRGPAAARNYGARLARAPHLAFLDSDDLWAPQKLLRQLAFMRQRPACTISQTQEIWMRNGSRVNPGRRHQKRAGDIFVDSLRTCLISPSAAMIRACVFRSAGGFDERMAAAEDYDLWLRVLVDYEVGLIDRPLVIRRAGHPDQLSAAVPALDRFRIMALAKLLAGTRLSAARREAVAQVLSEKCTILARGLERRGHHFEGLFFRRVGANALGKWRARPDASLEQAMAEMPGFVSLAWQPARHSPAPPTAIGQDGR